MGASSSSSSGTHSPSPSSSPSVRTAYTPLIESRRAQVLSVLWRPICDGQRRGASRSATRMTLSGALPLGLHNTLALPRATMLAGLGSVLAVRSVSELAEVQKRSADKQRWLVFDNEVELLSRGMTHPEPCMAAMALHGVLGGCMGVVVGLFLGTYEAIAPPIPMPGQPEPPKRTIMQEVREGWRRSGIKARSWGKNFAGVTLIWSGMECGVEKLRGAHDVYNAAIAGCATGAAMAAGQGPEAMCFGCVGFAVFATLMDMFMHRMT